MLIAKKKRVALALATVMGLAACGQTQAVYPDKRPGDNSPTWGDQKKETVFGSGGLDLFGSGKKKSDGEGGAGIGVNSYLWRASLDTVAFLPLASADPFGGVIITDWYSPPESPTERFKLTVFISDRTLRADGVRVSVFRQVQTSAGDWSDAAVDLKTNTDMENAILFRARELRTAANAVK
jgi:hypothetical protein